MVVAGLVSSAYAAQVLDTLPDDPRLESAVRKPVQVSSVDKIKEQYRRPKEIPFPADNPYTAVKAHLGRTLYFDPRLSRAGMQSCASCHNPSFSWGDGLPKGVGDGMKQLGRRSPTILNAAWGQIFMWDGRKESLEDQALGPIQADVEMNLPLDKLIARLEAVPQYRTLFAAAFPDGGKITADRIAKAIATYERTVVSPVAPFDRWIEGDEKAISDSAKRGFALFNGKAKCSGCHEGWRFTDDSFHDIGLADDDIGRGKFLEDIVKMQHAFKTPGLRNIVERAPYMHDGSVPDLKAVVMHYNSGGVNRPSRSDKVHPLGLTDAEVDDLVAFMRTLSSEDIPTQLTQLPN